ncbi:uncharacterized protein LOC131936799 [Physella acuta]|uniref:uncharacterized protein LOC131936799 n=1 Tax=Physella acuta TaxID=109671 RepID=UPI0027DB90EF|nr:uncharacterized protein LOC131936799 [Physella acuta]
MVEFYAIIRLSGSDIIHLARTPVSALGSYEDEKCIITSNITSKPCILSFDDKGQGYLKRMGEAAVSINGLALVMDKWQEVKHGDIIHVMGQKLFFYYPKNSDFNTQTNKRNELELPPPNFFKVDGRPSLVKQSLMEVALSYNLEELESNSDDSDDSDDSEDMEQYPTTPRFCPSCSKY